MKIDTSSYYPKSPLDEEENKRDSTQEVSSSLFPDASEKEKSRKNEDIAVAEIEKEIEDNKNAGSPKREPDYDPTEWERFLDNSSTTISWILVPLLMPVFGTLMAFNYSVLDYAGFTTKLSFTLIVAGINVLVPAFLILLLKQLGVVDDIGLNGRKERLIPYLITIGCMLVTAWFIYSKHAPMWFVMFFVGGAVAGVINLVINFGWKISAHSAAIAGIVALLIRIMHNGVPHPGILTWLIIWIAATGLLGSARVWLGRHTAAQVLAGYVVGFVSVFLITMI